jgi:ketosteroid isomerase-like protein
MDGEAPMQKRLVLLGSATVSLVLPISLATGATLPRCPEQRRPGALPAGIVLLHQTDERATLTGSADALAQLWTSDAVRMEPGGPAEVGRAAITAEDKKEEAHRRKGAAVLAYEPRICDVEVVGDRAIEWGYFRYVYRMRAGGTRRVFVGKLLRILKRQSDGSWKFSHVILNSAS